MKHIQFNTLRWETGAILAAVALGLLLSQKLWLASAVLPPMFLIAGCLKINTRRPATAFVTNALWAFLCILLSCLYPSWLMNYRFFAVGYVRIILNFVCAAAVYGVMLVITGRIRSASHIASCALMILCIVNCFVFQFRGTEMQPVDFLIAGTALNVAMRYHFTVPQEMLFCIILWVWSLFAFGMIPQEPVLKSRKWLRLVAAAATVCCVILFFWKGADVRPNIWSNQGTLQNGYLLNFCTGLRDCFVQEPEGYSEELIHQMEEEYSVQENRLPENLPDIIVIMDESLVDFRIIGENFHPSQPVTPFLDSLKENTVRGYALSPIFGGGTASAEFELLTGCSMAFLPKGAIAYQQYVRQELFSLPRLLGSYGYKTLVTHPYFSSGYNRTKVYPLLGFHDMTFLDDYPQENLLRSYVSDREMFTYLLNRLNRQDDAPMFLFGITMQNHGDFAVSDYKSTITLDGGDFPLAEQYFSLLHETDSAAEYLLAELEKSPRDTVVLLFGDHFPQVEGDFFRSVHGGTFDELQDEMLQYQVPFYIWANFDIPEQTVELTSLCYLSIPLLETAGLPLPPYYRFLKDASQVIPALNTHGYFTPDGDIKAFDDANGEEALWLSRYASMQYNYLFGKEKTSSILFPR